MGEDDDPVSLKQSSPQVSSRKLEMCLVILFFLDTLRSSALRVGRTRYGQKGRG